MDIPGNILIIDDESNLRTTMIRILQANGLKATAVADGEQAMNCLAISIYDLIYLDLNLPDINGIELLKKIRQAYPKIPVILLTGYGSMSSSIDAMRLGAVDYLIKPIDPKTVVQRAQTLLMEQLIEKRRHDIQEHIATLQEELRRLEVSATMKTGVEDEKQRDVINTAADSRYLTAGAMRLDLHAQRVILRERAVRLPSTTFDYLVVLTRHAPDVVDYRTLVAEAQGYAPEPSEARHLAKWHIHVIRQALEIDPALLFQIVNVRGNGYRLVLD